MEESGIEDREVCPDGSCVGVIGDDGRCGTCGSPREASTDAFAAAPAPTPPAAMDPEAETEADLDPDARVPCWDDRCVGILGEDGRCGICGHTTPARSQV